MKKCTKCNIDQPLENFNKNYSTKDGLTSYCKSCHKQINLENEKCFGVTRTKKNRKDLKNWDYMTKSEFLEWYDKTKVKQSENRLIGKLIPISR